MSGRTTSGAPVGVGISSTTDAGFEAALVTELSALYRQASIEEPLPSLDASILAAAHQAAREDNTVRRNAGHRPARPWWRNWLAATSGLAVMALGLSLTWRVMDEQEKSAREAMNAEISAAEKDAAAPTKPLPAAPATIFPPPRADPTQGAHQEMVTQEKSLKKEQAARTAVVSDGASVAAAARAAPATPATPATTATAATATSATPAPMPASRGAAALADPFPAGQTPPAETKADGAEPPVGRVYSGSSANQAPAALPSVQARPMLRSAPAPELQAAPRQQAVPAESDKPGLGAGVEVRRKMTGSGGAADASVLVKPATTNEARGSAEDDHAQRDERGLSPADWLQRVRDLRAAGRIDEARESLARFRTHYPDHVLPEDLKTVR